MEILNTTMDFEDENSSDDEILTPSFLSIPRGLVFFFFLGFISWKTVRRLLD